MEGIFYTKRGQALRGVTAAQTGALWKALTTDYGLSPLQLVEAASYSFAMVIRYALGLSAAGGRIGALVNDSRAGWVTLATVRHLANAGGSPHVIFLMDPERHGPEIAQLIKPLERMEIPMDHWSCLNSPEAIGEYLGGCHNVLCGLFQWPHTSDQVATEYIRILNEVQTPIHAVDAPWGIDPDSGKPCDEPLYASSTLSLGAPLCGLHAGHEFVGRHYLCDISLTRALYESVGESDLSPLFDEQPVTQLSLERPIERSA